MPHRATIVDVARAGGVAVGTASDALNGKGRISDATRDRVIAAAVELGFRAHRAARGLPSGMNMAIGLRFDHEAPVPAGSFFAGVLDSAARAAGDRGYGLLISTRDVDETAFVDGLVVVDPANDDDLDALLTQGLPVVTVGRARARHAGAPWVDVDHGTGLRALLDHLASQAAAPGPAWLISQTERYSFVLDLERAFEAWCDDHGAKPIILRTADHPRAAAEAIQGALANLPPPAIVSSVVDRQALGVHAALTSSGRHIPIGSASDDDQLDWLSPPVSALELDAAAHGLQAIAMVFDWLNTGKRPKNTLLPARLVAR